MSKQTQLTDDFFNRLETLLALRGWTLNRLSEETNISLNAYYQMRRRRTLPHLHTIWEMCKALDISLAEFFSFDHVPDPDIAKITARLESLSPSSVAVLASLVDCLK